MGPTVLTNARPLPRGALGGSEAWLDRAWEADDLVAVIRILARNRDALAGLNRGTARAAGHRAQRIS